jgi:hypothetical protein
MLGGTAFAHLAMKTKRLVLLVVLMVAAVTFSYRLGYRQGSNRTAAVTVAGSLRMIVGRSLPYPRNTFSAFPATDATTVPARQGEEK